MRALCGSIITAGALVGLGLTALGFGIRFQGPLLQVNPKTDALWGTPSMTLVLVICLIAFGIGLGIAFLGLAFHHERRYRELLHHETAAGTTSTRMPA
jgi:hypothetical protein